MVTVTPGMTPPVASETFPLIAPVVAPTACAKAGPPVRTTRHTIPLRTRSHLMIAPFRSANAAERTTGKSSRDTRYIGINELVVMTETLHWLHAGCNWFQQFFIAPAPRFRPIAKIQDRLQSHRYRDVLTSAGVNCSCRRPAAGPLTAAPLCRASDETRRPPGASTTKD